MSDEIAEREALMSAVITAMLAEDDDLAVTLVTSSPHAPGLALDLAMLSVALLRVIAEPSGSDPTEIWREHLLNEARRSAPAEDAG